MSTPDVLNEPSWDADDHAGYLRVRRAAPDCRTVWLTPEEATGYLGLPTRRALYQAVRRGTIPAHKLGRLLRFNRPELDRALLSRTTRIAG